MRSLTFLFLIDTKFSVSAKGLPQVREVSIGVENPDVDFGIGLRTGLIIPINDDLDFIGDTNYKIGINKSLDGEGYLYDLGAALGIRYHF